MSIILGLSRLLALPNAFLLACGRHISVVLMGLMVLAILIQVFFRYVLNNALPWPDEAARFAMLWLAGLLAPTAFRRGGFVAIDMLVLMLPRILGGLLMLLLLFVSLLVLLVAVDIGWSEVTGFAGKFKTAALKYPTDLTFSTWEKVPRSWMMSSLLVGFVLMLSVNVELILRQIATMAGREDDLPVIPESNQAGAE